MQKKGKKLDYQLNLSSIGTTINNMFYPILQEYMNALKEPTKVPYVVKREVKPVEPCTYTPYRKEYDLPPLYNNKGKLV